MLSLNTQLDLQNAIGFSKFYGFSPALNLMQESEAKYDIKELSFLLVECPDLRHCFQTISDLQKSGNKFPEKLEFCLYEKSHTTILRAMIMLEIVLDSELTLREKIDAFLDFYWNIFVTLKTTTVVENILNKLTNQLSNQKTAFFDLSLLKYKEKDSLLETADFWRKTLKSSLIKREESEDKFFFNRLRALYKERWPHRKNLADADYVWGITDNRIEVERSGEKVKLAPCVNIKEYLDFRETGVAFPVHSAPENHRLFNVSMLGYQSGRKKSDRGSCEVLGFWGDLVVSPFATLGMYLSSDEEYDKFYEQRNQMYVFTSAEIAEHNLEKHIEDFNALVNNGKTKVIFVPVMNDEKKALEEIKKFSKRFDTVYFSQDGFQQNLKKLEALKGLLKENAQQKLIIETIHFYTCIEIKKRKLLKEKMLTEVNNEHFKLFKDIEHHLIYEITNSDK